MESSTIPAFLSIDVEPDGFQLDRHDPPPWAGYLDLVDFITRLRGDLAGWTGRTPRFGWYVRTDPQIAEVYGRPDHALVGFPACAARLQAAGDYWGVHSHPIRWAPESGQWVHEFGDGDWPVEATRFALDAFRGWAGAPPRLFRAGSGFLTDRIVEAAEQAGVAIDLTLEPVTGWGVGAATMASGVDVAPVVGSYTDCGGAPREPYRPARHDFRVDGGPTGRRLLMVPLTTRSLVPTRPRWRRVARRVLRGPAPSWVEVLYPFGSWPHAHEYWDAVEQQLRSMRRPYLSLAIRTDAPNTDVSMRVRRILEALPGHPLATRLRFENPLTTFRDSL
jgi:hypothetical protein